MRTHNRTRKRKHRSRMFHRRIRTKLQPINPTHVGNYLIIQQCLETLDNFVFAGDVNFILYTLCREGSKDFDKGYHALHFEESSYPTNGLGSETYAETPEF